MIFIAPILKNFSYAFVSYFPKWSKYICQRFTTYGFKYDWHICWCFWLNARVLHLITRIHASCAVAPSSRCSTSLRLTLQNLKSAVSCWCSTLFKIFYCTCVLRSLVTPKYIHIYVSAILKYWKNSKYVQYSLHRA